MKAIPQVHGGITYRSRTEARWAEYFRLSRTDFQYEPEGYVLDGEDTYVPDFYLPYSKVFFEIKYAAPNRREVRVAEKLSFAAQAPVVIAHGNPWRGVTLTGIRPGVGWCRLHLLADDSPHSGGSLVSSEESGPRWNVRLSPFSLIRPPHVDPRLSAAGKLQFNAAGPGGRTRDILDGPRRIIRTPERRVIGRNW